MQRPLPGNSVDPGRIACAIKIIRAARAPLVVAVFAAIALAYPPQTREIYRALAEDPTRTVLQLALTSVILCAASFALALIARELLDAPIIPRAPVLLYRLLPRVCGSLMPAGLSAGLFLAASEAQIGTPPQTTLDKMPEVRLLLQALDASQSNLVVAGLASTMVTVSLCWPGVGFRSLRVRKALARAHVRITNMVWFGLACLVLFSGFTVPVSQFFGPVAIFLLSTIGFASTAALLTRAGDRRQLPILSGIVLFALFLALFDWTDNHRIELTEPRSQTLASAKDVFERWYDSRADRDYYAGHQKPYPVFIVAASGGGLYAADHAATVLSRLQDRCPNFSQHVFAISGVSGGSLGAALFANLAARQAKNDVHADCLTGSLPQDGGQFEQQIDHFMGTDFLSPVLGAALFPDAAQQFLPALTSRFDRSRAFEDTLALAWDKLYPHDVDNPWTEPFLKAWDPSGPAPALLLNSTNVEHGYRVVISPFLIIDWGELDNIVPLSNLAEFHRLTEERTGDSTTAKIRDISLATAVSLSARFPWVMPAGRLATQRGDFRLVDGGYVENSGSETAFDLVQGLERFYKKDDTLRNGRPPVQINIIVITSLQILQGNGSFGLGEALSPVRTMLSARETRAVVALSRIWRFIELCEEYSECGKRVEGSSFTLDLFDFHLPLGWLLAPSTRRIVELHSGVANRAGVYLGGSNIDDTDKFERLGAYAANNDAAACEIVSALQGSDAKTCN